MNIVIDANTIRKQLDMSKSYLFMYYIILYVKYIKKDISI